MGEPRAVRVGRVTAVAQLDAKGVRQAAERLRERGFGVRDTAHFTVCQRLPYRPRALVLLHTFAEAMVDEDLPSLLASELGPLGVLATADEYGRTLHAIVASTCPAALDCPRCGHPHLDRPEIWDHYCRNTLGRMRALLAAPPAPEPATAVERFATVYRRIGELRAGASVLDAGSNLGLLPVLLAERGAGPVLGCDLQPDAVARATNVAHAAGVDVRFELRDVLAPDFPEIGRYDTVTAVHLLEHLTEAETPVALDHLLGAAARRLIVAVPYEHVLEPLYGHRQVFTPDRLRALGRRCVGALGAGRAWCEDVCGGLLVVDRVGG